MSELLHFAEHRLQEVALAIMAIVYTTRLIWLFRFTAGKERQPATGLGDTSARKGFIYSWANIAQPWEMESTRTKLFLYMQFALFHIGVVSAIALSFIIPYAPGILNAKVMQLILQVLIGAAFIVGVMRIVRRAGSVYMRAVSSPDDHFSLVFLTAWFAFAFLSIPNNYQAGETILIVYFFQTAFFLLYVPFSKISHYLYYPFTRYYLGKSLGRRGVYPIRKTAA
jgi:nitrate reductase gamma subunit